MTDQSNIKDSLLIDKYIKAKKIAYRVYDVFSQAEDSSKLNFLNSLCQEIKKNNEDFYDEFVENIITNTLLYPNDKLLLDIGKTNALVTNIDKILDETNIGLEMLRLKSREFQLFDFSRLLKDGEFKDIDYDNFPVKVDDLCKNYVSGNISVMKKNKNK